METFFYPEQYAILWRSSWLALGTGSYAIYRHHYDYATICYIVWLTSLNHWQYPRMTSWNRYLDVSCVRLSLAYHLITAFYRENVIPYYILILLGILCYYTGDLYYAQNNYWTATYCHLLVHILGNVGNVILYSSGTGSPPIIDKI